MGRRFQFNHQSNARQIPQKNNKDTFSNDLEQLINNFDLKDICREIFPIKPFYTFRRGITKSRIDKIYATKNIKAIEYKQESFSLSDHEIVSVEIIYENNCNKGKGIWRNKTKFYEKENFNQNSRHFGKEIWKEIRE